MKRIAMPALFIFSVAGVVVANGALYTVSEVEQVVITQFGRPVGEPVTEAGLKVKLPFVQDLNVIDRRVLEWDGTPSDMPTKDKLYISVDLFGRWRITDPLQYYLRLRDERSAQSRLDDILGSETRNAVAKHELIELIRTTRDRVPLKDAVPSAALDDGDPGADGGSGPETLATDGSTMLPEVGTLVPIHKGREIVEQEIFDAAAKKVGVFGIELLDIRFKRINYNESVRPKIYERMISERRQIAERYLSEGHGEAARIRGNRVRDLDKIQSEAYREVEAIRGEADAKATAVYSSAFNQSPMAVEFYEFTRTMQAYRAILSEDTTLVLSTDSDLLRYLKAMKPEAASARSP
jgi:membrane protease subunit HflC